MDDDTTYTTKYLQEQLSYAVFTMVTDTCPLAERLHSVYTVYLAHLILDRFPEELRYLLKVIRDTVNHSDQTTEDTIHSLSAEEVTDVIDTITSLYEEITQKFGAEEKRW